MYVDGLLILSGNTVGNTVTGQAVTAAAVSTNTIDLSSGGLPSGQTRDMGEGERLFGRFQVMVAAAGGTSMEFQIIQADDAALTANVNVVASTGAIPIANLGLGTRHACQLRPRIGSLGQRYMGARYVPVGTFTAGSYFADIGTDIQDGAKFHTSGFGVL